MPLTLGSTITSPYAGGWTPRVKPGYVAPPSATELEAAARVAYARKPHLRHQVIEYPFSGLDDLMILLLAVRGAYAGPPYVNDVATAIGCTAPPELLLPRGVGGLSPAVWAYRDTDAVLFAVEGTRLLRQWLQFADAVTLGTVAELPGKVYPAFTSYFTDPVNVFGAIFNYLDAARDVQYALVGHSLGGALCEIVGRLMAVRHRRPPTMIATFGAPRVGNREFARNTPCALTRVRVKDDPVPLVPPTRLSLTAVESFWQDTRKSAYQHSPGTPVILDPTGRNSFFAGENADTGDEAVALKSALFLTDKSELHAGYSYAVLLKRDLPNLMRVPWGQRIIDVGDGILAGTGY